MNKLLKSCLTALAAAAVCSASIAAVVAPSHQAKGVPCQACHTTMPFADYNKCIACHGGKEALIKSNPQHLALKSGDVPCSICHQGHQ